MRKAGTTTWAKRIPPQSEADKSIRIQDRPPRNGARRANNSGKTGENDTQKNNAPIWLVVFGASVSPVLREEVGP